MGDKGAIERECGQLEARLQKLRSARDMDRGALGTMHERVSSRPQPPLDTHSISWWGAARCSSANVCA